MPIRFVVIGFIAGLLFAHARASAQSCHCQHDPGESQDSVNLRTFVIIGRDPSVSPARDFEGLGLDVLLSYWRLQLAATATAYRLPDSPSDHYGFGDTSVALRGIVFRTESDPWLVTVGVRSMMPSGNADVGLGMGHFMLGPEVQASKSWGLHNVFLSATYLYGIGAMDHDSTSSTSTTTTTTGSTTHHHHTTAAPSYDFADVTVTEHMHGAYPPVDPHNMSELVLIGGGAWNFIEGATLRASTLWLVPIAAEMGQFRGAVTPGIGYAMNDWRVALDMEITIAGAPNLLRGFVSFAYRFGF